MEEKRCKLCGDLYDDWEELTDGVCSFCRRRMKAVGKIVNKKSACINMEEFEPVFYKNSKEWIEITEWQNGEGVDIHIESDDKDTNVSLHVDELDAIASLLDRVGYLPMSYCPKDETKE